MTNLQRLEETFTALGIPYTREDKPQRVIVKETVVDRTRVREKADCATSITLGSGVGYACFEAIFYFDADGKFLSHAVYE